MTPFFALGLFAGLRTAELFRLDWQSIDLKRHTIEIASDVSKTREHRYVKIAPNLRAWLSPYKRANGPVTAPAWRWHRNAAREAAGLVKWPDNGMRHSFGSYHFALSNNAPVTAAEMGHRGSTGMLFGHYRRLVTQTEATAYWNIRPGAVGEEA